MSAPALAIIGRGRMGGVVEALARERGWRIAAVIGAAGNPDGQGITRDSLSGADVAIEFTEPAAAPANVRACAAAGCPVVTGTTGWQEQLEAVAQDVRAAGGAMLWAPNFSIGVAIFTDLVARAAGLLASVPGFDAQLVETHHAAKHDAPSGTAIALRRAAAALGDVPITSVRIGHVPGTHLLIADGPFEQLRLEHVARDRRVFAEGALVAARWLVGRRGVYTLRDVLTLPASSS